MADEPSLRSRLKPRFRGALLGGAVGDALGFPYQGSSRSFLVALGTEIVARFAKHRTGYFPPGQYSDDTQLTLATVSAILSAGRVDGQSVADHFTPLWRENAVIGRADDCTEAIMKLIQGRATWENSGAPRGRAGSSPASRAAPIGLWNYDEPQRLLEDIAVVSRITHRDERSVAGAAAVAAAIAYNVTHREVILGELIDAISGAAAHFSPEFAGNLRELPALLSLSEERVIERFAAMSSGGADEPHRENRDGIAPFVVPTVLVAFFYFLRSPTDYQTTVRNCLLVGGDVDTVAAIAGALSGALNGIEGIPKPLAASVLHRDRIVGAADRLHVLKEETRAVGT